MEQSTRPSAILFSVFRFPFSVLCSLFSVPSPIRSINIRVPLNFSARLHPPRSLVSGSLMMSGTRGDKHSNFTLLSRRDESGGNNRRLERCEYVRVRLVGSCVTELM